MNGNTRRPRFDIPIPLIVLAYIVHFPVGIVLTVLKIVFSVINTSPGTGNSGNTSGARINFDNLSQNSTYQQRASAATGTGPVSEKARQQYNEYVNRTQQANAQQNTGINQNANAQQTTFGKVTQSSYTGSSAQKKASETAQKKETPKSKTADSKSVTLTRIFGIVTGIISLLTMFGISGIDYFLFVTLPLMLTSAGLLVGSHFLKRRDIRLARIKAIIGNRQSINLSKLAAASDVSIKKVRNDLQKLIDKGEFGDQAYIDLGTNNFMRTPQAEPDDPAQFDYTKLYGNTFKKKNKNEQTAQQTQDTPSEEGSDDNFSVIIKEIRRLNSEIKDKEVSSKIDEIEIHTKNIFDYITYHPEATPQIRTFMNYYLPTTLKLLESYSGIEKVGVAGENMKKSKKNIEQILDMLVAGFKQQYDQLFKKESIDISSDISVLETMLAKDGLSHKEGFDIADMMNSYTDDISGSSGTASAGGAAAAEAPDKE
ncbi:MAG: 5-bromo-4-chloroindolyl phosphate hydrolysis family protein [Clostridia bacterium]|nr:5-bromo-4-chloroindolyl phosphate hydrolysis family protein [Clostridia bacterium]